MTHCTTHPDHSHTHDAACGHIRIQHDDHVDYLHDGHLHFPHGDHYDEHHIAISSLNPDGCAPSATACAHVHGPSCGHEAVPHGDHVDYLVDGRLHHVHDGHCDDHGPITVL